MTAIENDERRLRVGSGQLEVSEIGQERDTPDLVDFRIPDTPGSAVQTARRVVWIDPAVVDTASEEVRQKYGKALRHQTASELDVLAAANYQIVLGT
jgi:hypothetical protein